LNNLIDDRKYYLKIENIIHNQDNQYITDTSDFLSHFFEIIYSLCYVCTFLLLWNHFHAACVSQRRSPISGNAWSRLLSLSRPKNIPQKCVVYHRFLFNVTCLVYSAISYYRSSNDFLEIIFLRCNSIRVILYIRNFIECAFIQCDNKLKIQCDNKLRISTINEEYSVYNDKKNGMLQCCVRSR